jgi:hypothetical protein
MSIILFIWSTQNENKNNSKYISIIGIFSAIYLGIIFLLSLSGSFFCVEPELGRVVMLFFLTILAEIFYITSILINFIKAKKMQAQKNSKHMIFIIVFILLIPLLLLTVCFGREVFLLNNSELILCVYYCGNGGFGDGRNAVYVVREDYCKEVSTGTDYGIEDFFINPVKSIEVEYGRSLVDCEYVIKVIEEEYKKALIYKGDIYIGEIDFNSNATLKKAFFRDLNVQD